MQSAGTYEEKFWLYLTQRFGMGYHYQAHGYMEKSFEQHVFKVNG
jgi:hypothetical protein